MIPITKPTIGPEEAEAAARVVRGGWTTQGPEVAAFEEELAEFVGAKHACAVSNCTTALHLALRVVGVEPGDEVITVSHSFIATANAVVYCGARPVFVDVDRRTFNMDPGKLADAITPRTRAILCVHQMGMPCDLQQLLSLARQHELPLIEDAACAIGSEILVGDRWERIGGPHGDIACFSLHPRKLINTGDGGMITTGRADWDESLRRLRQHGMSIPDTVRHTSAKVLFETYPVLGFNYRLTDIQAAIGREQLRRVPDLVRVRRELAARYGTLLANVGLEAPFEPPFARSNWQSFCVRLPDGCDQKAVMQAMLDSGVSTRRGIMCAHREQPYLGMSGALPESESAQDNCILLPLFTQLSSEEQEYVVSCLVDALDRRLENRRRA
jgi:dTDP-4-amino-4,6-dideoxygalactose transaminase